MLAASLSFVHGQWRRLASNRGYCCYPIEGLEHGCHGISMPTEEEPGSYHMTRMQPASRGAESAFDYLLVVSNCFSTDAAKTENPMRIAATANRNPLAGRPRPQSHII